MRSVRGFIGAVSIGDEMEVYTPTFEPGDIIFAKQI